MTALSLILDGVALRLPETDVHYLYTDGGRLRVGKQPRAAHGFGYLVFQVDAWWLHASLDRCPPELRLNGGTVTKRSVELVGGRAELTLHNGSPTSPSRPANRPPGSARPPDPARTARATQPPNRTAGATGAARTAPGGAGPARPKGRRPTYVIGRAGSGANIEIDDPQVRTEHALLEVDSRGRWWITESAGQVHVDGKRVMAAVLEPGKVVVLGQTAVTASPALFTDGPVPGMAKRAASGDALRMSAGRGLSVDVNGVTVRKNGRMLLDNVDLHIGAGQVVAVVGPSGAGKSSLIKLLLGEHQPDPGHGTLTIGGASRRRSGRLASRQQVRYVPQSESDDLYSCLTVAETLAFAARFRAAPNTAQSYVDARVTEALTWLGLDEHRGSRVQNLSGGQRRRVSIGTELVGRPQLLLLDEPTSGLDMGKDRDIMARLRTISREFHCTVIVVTHSVSHLEFADQVVVMARGGRVRYAGPPVTPTSQGHAGWADWLTELDEPPGRAAVAAAGRPARRSSPPPAEVSLAGFPWALRRQALVVWRRGLGSLALLLGMPVIGTLLAILAAGEGLRPEGGSMTQVLAILVTVAALTGAALTYLDLVSDWAILRRDWRVGVSAESLVLAKASVFGAICAVLAAAMTILYSVKDLPPPAFGMAPRLVLFLSLFLIMAGSMGLGLFISARADSLEQAVTLNTLLAVLQVALNGALFHLPLVLAPVSLLLPSRLGLAAIASYADLNRFRAGFGYQDTLWHQGQLRLWLVWFGMVLVGVVATAAAIWVTERRWHD